MKREATEIQKRDTRRALWLIGIAGLGVVALLAYRFFVDEPPVDDAAFLGDLASMPEPAPNPLAEYQDWLDAHKPLRKSVYFAQPFAPKQTALETVFGRSLERINADPPPPDRRERLELLPETDRHVAKLEELLKTDHSQWRWRGLGGKTDLVSLANDPGQLGTLVRIFEVRARILARASRAAQALEETLLLMQFAARAEVPDGIAMHSLTAARLSREADALLGGCVRAIPMMTQPELKQIGDRIAGLAPRRDLLARKLRCEYLATRNALRARTTETLLDGELQPPWNRMLKRQQTTRLFLESAAAFDEAAPHGWAAVQRTTARVQTQLVDGYNPSWRAITTGNVTGLHWWSSHVWRLREMILLHREAEALRDMTRLQLAARQFELASGRLPARLEELAPDFIAEIPHDPFGTELIRWSSATQVIYSIGHDGVDDGGAGRTPLFPGPDLADAYWWKPPAPPKGAR